MIKNLLGVPGAVLVGAALLMGSAQAATVIVDFESLPTTAVDQTVGDPFVENGFEFSSNVEGDLNESAFSVWGVGNANRIDTNALFSTFPTAVITLKRVDDSPFTLQTMQLGPVFEEFTEGNVSFVGTKSSGGFVTRTFALSGTFEFTLLDFGADPQNGGSFDDLLSVSFMDESPSFQFDNIQTEVVVVPEPSTALLALAGLAMLGLWRAQITRRALQRVSSV